MSVHTSAASDIGRWSSSHIVLIGEMGTGKTTVGRLLAEMVGRPLLDSDELVQDRIGETGADFAASEGVEALHDLELSAFLDAVASSDEAVISPAASVVDSRAGREALRDNVVVWLDAPIEVYLERMAEGDHRRSVDVEDVEHLRRRRLRHYRRLADLHVQTERAGPTQLAAEIAGVLPGFRRPPEG